MKPIFSFLGFATFAVLAYAGALNSGLNIGEMVPAFHPQHVSGPHKGTDACPPCTYGNLPMVQIWVNGDSAENVKAFAKLLDERIQKDKASQFKGFVIYLTPKGNVSDVAKTLEKIAKDAKTNHVSIAYLNSSSNSVKDYKVNTDKQVKNTVFVYKNRKVTTKFVNLNPDKKGLAALNKAIDEIVR